MNLRHALVAALVVLCAQASAAPARTGPGSRPWSDYEVLATLNIFSRVRGAESRATEERVERQAPSPERCMFLRGVVRREAHFVAVLEDMRSGQTVQVGAGDNVLDGRAGRITLDGITYVRADEREVFVAVGSNLEGNEATGAPSMPGAGAEPATAGEQGTDEASALLERLRQRRLEELGQ
jgi:hypothetical protein